MRWSTFYRKEMIHLTATLQKLWGIYSADFRRFLPQELRCENLFGCPLCLHAFWHEPDITQIVAKEHILPRRLAGEGPTTLTCRRCNNTAGAKLEYSLVQRVRLESRKLPFEGRFVLDGIEIGVKVQWPESPGGVIEAVTSPKESDPREVTKLQERLSKGDLDGVQGRFDFNFKYTPLKSALALVRAAYLLMFRIFGYHYVIDKSAEVIREQLDQPDDETPVLKGLSWNVAGSTSVSEAWIPSRLGISIVTEPRELRSAFIVFIPLTKEPDRVSTVLLPPFGADGAEFYRLLGQAGNPLNIAFSRLLKNHETNSGD